MKTCESMRTRTYSKIILLFVMIINVSACTTVTIAPSRETALASASTTPSMLKTTDISLTLASIQSKPAAIVTWTPTPTHPSPPSTRPNPTVDLTHSWSTYTNTIAGYSFQYPLNASLESRIDKEGQDSTFIHVPLGAPSMIITIEVQDNLKQQSLDQIYIDGYASYANEKMLLDPAFSSLIHTHEYLEKAGAYAVKGYGTVDFSYQILALHDSRLFIFTMMGYEGVLIRSREEQKTFDKIISSFRFLD